MSFCGIKNCDKIVYRVLIKIVCFCGLNLWETWQRVRKWYEKFGFCGMRNRVRVKNMCRQKALEWRLLVERLLIVEDDKTLSEGLCYLLKEIDYRVKAVQGIYEAREILAKESIALIILDCNLPDGSGYDFCEEIRKEYYGKILILTARNTELDEVQAFKAGADDYISKPFSTAVLLERIKNLLRRRENHNLVSNGVDTWFFVSIGLSGGRLSEI